MKHQRSVLLLVSIVVLGLVGCASKPQKDTRIIAPDQDFTPKGATSPWKIGGVYDKKDKSIAVTFNQNPVLRGNMGGPMPRVRLTGVYEKKNVDASCEFSSNVPGGMKSKIIMQHTRGNTANTCVVTVDGTQAATLYF